MTINNAPSSTVNETVFGGLLPDIAEFFLEAGWCQAHEGRVFNEDKTAMCPECGDNSDAVEYCLWVSGDRTPAAVLEIHNCEDGHVWRKCHVGPLDPPVDIAAQVALGHGHKLTLPSGEVLRSGWLDSSES